MENTEPNSIFTQSDGGGHSFSMHHLSLLCTCVIEITLSLLSSCWHFSGWGRKISEPLKQRVIKAIMGYAQVPWEHVERAPASVLGIRGVLSLKVSSEGTRARVSQRCEWVCVCVLQGGCGYEENKHQHSEVEKLPVPPHYRVLSRKVTKSGALFGKLPLTIVRRRDERKASWRLLHSVNQATDNGSFEQRRWQWGWTEVEWSTTYWPWWMIKWNRAKFKSDLNH